MSEKAVANADVSLMIVKFFCYSDYGQTSSRATLCSGFSIYSDNILRMYEVLSVPLIGAYIYIQVCLMCRSHNATCLTKLEPLQCFGVFFDNALQKK